MSVTYFRGLAAEALIHFGQHDDAVAQIDQAFGLMEETGEGFWKAELMRLSGEVALRAPAPDIDAVESTLLDAHKVAKGQGARALELRTATSLARLWQQQGKKTEACELLSEIYNWFTEGFDTKDLLDAKALLEELG
jgi:predicted ATPase